MVHMQNNNNSGHTKKKSTQRSTECICRSEDEREYKCLAYTFLVQPVYRVSPKNGTIFLYQILSDFRNCFTVIIMDKICNNTVIKNPTTPKVRQFAPLSDISQGSVARHLGCGGIFSDSIIANFAPDSNSEQISKIG